MVTEARIRPFLHTLFVAPVAEGGRMTAAIIEAIWGLGLRPEQLVAFTSRWHCRN